MHFQSTSTVTGTVPNTNDINNNANATAGTLAALNTQAQILQELNTPTAGTTG